MLLTDNVALVTGASSGIGRATALRLAAAGSHVALVARNADRIAHVADDIRNRGGSASTHVVDVSDVPALQRLVADVERNLGRLDQLVNAAGVMSIGPSLDIPVSDWQSMIDTNITGLIMLSKLCLPLMLSSVSSNLHGVGDIVNIASVAGRSAKAHHSVYCATKWAVIGFSEGLRQEFAQEGLRVTVVEPGLTATEIFDKQPGPAREYFRGITTDKPILQADEVAEVVEFTVTRPAHIGLSEIVVRPAQQR